MIIRYLIFGTQIELTNYMKLSPSNIPASFFETGILHIPNTGIEYAKQIMLELGSIIHVTDVQVKPGSRGLVTSDKRLGFHTDHHKAKYILWYCVEQTDEGGESLLIDARSIYRELSCKQQVALQSVRLYEHKVFEDDEESVPMVRLWEGKPHFYYSFWLLEKEMGGVESEAVKAFERHLRSSPFLKLKLQPQDLLLIDNRFILHGRTAITGTKKRLLRRFWIA